MLLGREQWWGLNFSLFPSINMRGKVSSLGPLMAGIAGASKWVMQDLWLDDEAIKNLMLQGALVLWTPAKIKRWSKQCSRLLALSITKSTTKWRQHDMTLGGQREFCGICLNLELFIWWQILQADLRQGVLKLEPHGEFLPRKVCNVFLTNIHLRQEQTNNFLMGQPDRMEGHGHENSR